MKRSTGARAAILAASAAAATAAQSADLSGTIVYDGGTAIPAGHIEVYLEDPAIADKASRRIARLRLESDGKSKAVTFALVPPEGLAHSPTQRIVVRLERPDGWLLARGTTKAGTSAPLQVELTPVMY